MPQIPLAIQLYTLRALTKTDFIGTVREVARIGYAGVELAGYGNLESAEDVRKVLDDNNLKVAGSHVALDKLTGELNRALDESQTLGNRNIICPIARPRPASADEWKRLAETLNTVGAGCRDRNVAFAYHNHSFEFETFDGQSGLDILWANTDPALVKAELDVYWVHHGGGDPVEMMNRLGDRVLLLHLKDMASGEERRFAPVGTGVLDFLAILSAADDIGVQWNIVEQDQTYDADPLEAARTSFENLKRLGAI